MSSPHEIKLVSVRKVRPNKRNARTHPKKQIEQIVRIAAELGREIANAREAREIYKIGVQYNSVEETLAKHGMVPNRQPGQRALPNRYAA